MPKRKCKQCKEYFEEWVKHPSGVFCTHNHAIVWAYDKRRRDAKKAWGKEKKERKKVLAGRTGKKGYYEKLKTELHYYVKHILRKGEPCYTCGKLQKHTDDHRSFHVGHFIPAGTVDPRRFMLEGLRIQCYSCNVPNFGRRVEYRAAMIAEVGLEFVEWFECEASHKSLKEQYPDLEDIEEETAKYRDVTRAHRRERKNV